MPLWNEYHLPTSVEEAVAVLTRYDGQARVVAGGTDLILDLQQGNEHPVAALVDVTRIAGLDVIREDAGTITLGCGVTHNQIVESQVLHQKATALVEASYVVGGPQVRNVATIGGNVAHALPAADGTTALNALDAEVEVASYAGRRWLPFTALFRGPGQSAVDSTREVIVAIRFKAMRDHEASASSRIMRPQGVALPILGVAAKLALDESLQRVAHAAIAVGPAGPIPFRASEAEQALVGAAVFDDTAVDAAAHAALAQAELRTSKHRASKEYRREVLDVLLRRVLRRAFVRAQAEPGA